MILITGGTGSGKSEYAEAKAVSLAGNKELLYVATMSKIGEEAKRRIARHRKMRAGKGFVTLESMYLDEEVEIFRNQVVLVEDLSNLLSNYMFLREGLDSSSKCVTDIGTMEQFTQNSTKKTVDIIYKILSAINDVCRELIIVTNEIFSDGITYDASVMNYIENLAILNRRLAEKSQQFVEIVYGIPIELKNNFEA